MNATVVFAPKQCTPISPITQRRHLRSLSLLPIKCSSTDGNNAAKNDGGNPSPRITPPDTVEIRFRRGSRRRRSRAQQQKEDGVANGLAEKAETSAAKNWESMNLGEKAIELYMGEKGLLFWINKFAYASIFIVIGVWILFRFVGPALNLYQLDSPPLSPTSIFKG